MHKVTITMKGGKASVKVEGVKGKACEQVTEGIERELGIVTDKTKTREYNEKAQTKDATAEH